MLLAATATHHLPPPTGQALAHILVLVGVRRMGAYILGAEGVVMGVMVQGAEGGVMMEGMAYIGLRHRIQGDSTLRLCWMSWRARTMSMLVC